MLSRPARIPLFAAFRLSKLEFPTSLFLRSGLTSMLRLASVGLSFLVSIIFARILSIHDYGLYVYWITIASIICTLTGLGIPKLATRQIAAARGRECLADTYLAITYASFLTLIISGLVTFSAIFIFWFASQGVLDDSHTWLVPLAVCLLAVPLTHIYHLVGSIFTGFEQVLRAQILALLPFALNVIAGAVLWSIMRQNVPLMVVLWLQVLNGLIVALISVWYALGSKNQERLRVGIKDLPSVATASIWLRQGVFFAISQLLVNAITQVDIIMLGQMATAESVAHYQVASRIAYIVTFFYASVCLVIAPTIARLHVENSGNGLASAVQRSGAAAWVGTIAIATIVVLLQRPLLDLFGPQFAAARDAMLVLVGSWSIAIAFGPAYTVLAMTGAVSLTVAGLGVALVVNALLNLLLIPPLGAAGAAWASLVSTVGFSAGFWLLVQRRLGIRTDIFALIVGRQTESSKAR